MEPDQIDNPRLAEDASASITASAEHLSGEIPLLEASKMDSIKDICKDDDRTEGGTKSDHLEDKSDRIDDKIQDGDRYDGANDKPRLTSPTSTLSSGSTCEGWDIVEDTGSSSSGDEEIKRPKFCILGHSASEMALSKKVKYDALKEEKKKIRGDRCRTYSENSKETKQKHHDEQHRRRAYTAEKNFDKSKKDTVTNPLVEDVDGADTPLLEITKPDSSETIHKDNDETVEESAQKIREVHSPSLVSSRSSLSTCEGWDIVEDSESEGSGNEEMKRPKFCVLGHSASEMALSRKVKYDALKVENSKFSGDRRRSHSGDNKSMRMKHHDERQRRRAMTAEKDSIESKKNERKANSEDYGSPQLERPKFCSFGHSNVEMVLSKRAKYEADKEEHEMSVENISEQMPTEKGADDDSKTGCNEKDSKMSSVSSLLLGVADVALATSCNVKFEVGEENEEEKEKEAGETASDVAQDDNDADNDRASSPKRRVMFGNVSDDDEDDKSAANGVRMNGRPISSERRRIAFDNGVDHSKMGDMLGEMGHYGERKDTSKKTDSDLEPKPLFVQLNEHYICPLNDVASWKPRARWIKFEENWEEGADRWSKPHVASLTFNSLPQLRRGLENGLIMLDIMETSLPDIFNHLVEGLVSMKLIDPEHQGALLKMLHLYGTGNKSPVPRVSSGRRMSLFPVASNSHLHNNDDNFSNNASLSSELQEVHIAMPNNGHNQNANNSQHHPHHHLGSHKEGILKKLPEDSEGAMVMVAMEDSLSDPVAVLIRLENPPVLDHFLEAPIPLRFIFFLVGPDYSNVDYREVGRAMSTLFSDDIFRELAYKATDRKDLLNGINEFLNDTMVLPPGDWDRDLLLPITRKVKREQEKVMQRRKTISPLQMQADADAILKMQQAFALEALKHTDPLERTGQIFGGLINDVKRRFPHYKSDFTNAFNFQCVFAFVFVYFACLSPAITFGGLLGKKTDNYMGVSEMIVSTSLCGMLFALLSGQPLVILGGTGPVLIFEEYLYKACKTTDIDFMAFRVWIGLWICVLATIVVAFEGSILVRYFTRFTEEIFSTLISVIFVYEVYKGLEHILCANPVLPNYCFNDKILNGTHPTLASDHYPTVGYDFYTAPPHYFTTKNDTYNKDGYDSKYEKYNCNATYEKHAEKKDYGCHPSDNPHPNTALFAIILTFATFFISFFLKIFRSSQFLGRMARRALANFGIAIAIFTIVTIAYSVNDILYTDKIKITDGFHPTDPCKRGWLINPMGQKKTTPVYAIFLAIIPAFLVFILLYMETLLIGMVVNKEGNKLHKGTGYHLDLFLIGILSALAGVMGLPWMCAAPIRTVSHIGSLSVLTRTHAPGVKPKLDHIKDQRVTNFAVSFLIGLSTLLAPVLRQVPIAALLGVFLYLGITSLSGLQFVERLKILFMPQKHHPDVRYIRMVKMWKMHAFTVIQIVCVMGLYLIKNSIIAMAFPFCLILLVILRRLLKYIFTESELEALDSEEEDEDEDVQVFDIDLG